MLKALTIQKPMTTIHHSTFTKSLLTLTLIAGITACAEPGQSTTVGAATGGVIGAGLGAIVGSQVGSAGAGLVIGGAAGASAGAVVGNAFDAQDEKIRAQSELINHRDEAIRSQRTQIENLRRASSDTPSTSLRAGSTDLSGARARYSATPLSSANSQSEAYSGSVGEVKLASAEEIARARARTENKTSTGSLNSQPTTSRSSLSAPPLSASTTTHSTPREIEVIPARNNAPQISETTSAKSIEPAPVKAAVVDTKPRLVNSGNSKFIEKDLVAPVEDISASPAAESASALSVNSTDTGECGNAAAEIVKAESVTESADKLFHLRRALRMCPDNAQYHKQLGDLYNSLNREKDGEFEYKEAQRLDPTIQLSKNSAPAVEVVQPKKKGDRY